MCSYKHSVDYTVHIHTISIAGLNDYTSFISMHTDINQIKIAIINLEPIGPIGHCREWLIIIRSHSACNSQ